MTQEQKLKLVKLLNSQDDKDDQIYTFHRENDNPYFVWAVEPRVVVSDREWLCVCHLVERILDVNQLSRYADELDKICVPTHICPLTHWQATVMADENQRAEALIKVLG